MNTEITTLDQFRSLMTDYYRLTESTPVPLKDDMHRLRLFDVVVQLSHQLHVDGDGIFMAAYFDIATKEGSQELLLALLSTNFLTQVVGTPTTFSINPATGQVVASTRVPLIDLNAEILAQRIEVFVKSAKELRFEMTNPVSSENADTAPSKTKGSGMRRQLMSEMENYNKKSEDEA